MEKQTISTTDESSRKRPYQKCQLERCNEDISDGKLGRKFCSDGHKNEYNNTIKIKEHAEIRRIDLALKVNRRILKKLLGDKPEVTVTEKKLLDAGFNFDFSTHSIMSKRKKNKFIFSYNYGYHCSLYGYRIVKSFYGDEMPE